MPTITKTVNGKVTTYFYDGVKKYVHAKNPDGYEYWYEYNEQGNEVHYRNSNGFELWREYDEQGNEVYCKNSNGDERWSDDNPNNPKNKPLTEEDVRPFEFGNK